MGFWRKRFRFRVLKPAHLRNEQNICGAHRLNDTQNRGHDMDKEENQINF